MRVPILLLVFAVCGCGPDQSTYDELATELSLARDSIETLTELVTELRNTPSERLARARRLEKQGNLKGALAEYGSLIRAYPDAEEAATAQRAIAAAEADAAREAAEKERLARLGLRTLRVQGSATAGAIKLSVRSVSVRSKWIFDRHGDRYHYLSAKRGHRFIVADFSISSEARTPTLPVIAVFRPSSDRLHRVAAMTYEFHRWKDYGAYLGNYPDFGNDFAYTKSIRFSAGLEVTEDYAASPLFILVSSKTCVRRQNDQFSNPPVSYRTFGCEIPQSLSVEEAARDYLLIRVLNAGKL